MCNGKLKKRQTASDALSNLPLRNASISLTQMTAESGDFNTYLYTYLFKFWLTIVTGCVTAKCALLLEGLKMSCYLNVNVSSILQQQKGAEGYYPVVSYYAAFNYCCMMTAATVFGKPVGQINSVLRCVLRKVPFARTASLMLPASSVRIMVTRIVQHQLRH